MQYYPQKVQRPTSLSLLKLSMHVHQLDIAQFLYEVKGSWLEPTFQKLC